MAHVPQRDLATEASKHFRGTAAERVTQALRLGRRGLLVFHSTLPPETPLAAATEKVRRIKQRGRRPSRVMEERRG